MDKKFLNCRPEIWGGVECTINRVNNAFRDQLDATGHYQRTEDLQAFAALGITKLRYPLLWERHQPQSNTKIDWSWAQRQLNEIRALQIEPVVGLLHHGSGPIFTNLCDATFPYKLAQYAGKVARQFPWINLFTPVNEPLTTARFSGLYGHWYPHRCDEYSFVKMLLNQVKGIVLSMKAIREINPEAELIQTEDLAKTHSTLLLSGQAAYENERRWLTYDLLCGKVDKHHFFWDRFIALGIPESDLYFFLENICTPDTAGFNYYVTSERFLDEKVENYPSCMKGGNEQYEYVDTEAVRAGTLCGLYNLLNEAWERYQLPMAITECQLSCTREEQLRWLKETWDTAVVLNQQGVPVTAVTAWSLLGACDWNSLLTRADAHYESGVFDIRNGSLRPTALVKLIKSLAEEGDFEHPLLAEKGWWNPTSFDYVQSKSTNSYLLFIHKDETIKEAISDICIRRNIAYRVIERTAALFTETESNIQNGQNPPWAIIHLYHEQEGIDEECQALADSCSENDIPFTSLSINSAPLNSAIDAAINDVIDMDTNNWPETVYSEPISQLGNNRNNAKQAVVSY